MFIKKERSGKGHGRGQYEIRDAHDVISSIVDKQLILNVLGCEIVSGIFVRKVASNKARTQFKYRLRKYPKDAKWIQMAWQLTTALLLPRLSSEEDAWKKGRPVLRDNAYTMKRIRVSSLIIDSDTVHMSFDRLVFRNEDNIIEIDCAERQRLVTALWDQSDKLPEAIGHLVDRHKDYVLSGSPLTMDAVNLVSELQHTAAGIQYPSSIKEGMHRTDVVPTLLEALGNAIHLGSTGLESLQDDDLDEVKSAEIKRRLAKRFGLHVVRAGGSERFRREVQDAYDSTCIVCGLKLPAFDVGRNPGVDSAHVLKWADFDLDVVGNGVCLCKLHHWAFDEGLIEIRFDDPNYFVEIPTEAVDSLERNGSLIDLGFLREHEGLIPVTRLPRKDLRPEPRFLALFRERRWPGPSNLAP